MNDDTSAMKHHPYGPSRYNAWAKCPAYRQKEVPGDEDASAGARAHEELSKCLMRKGYASDNSAAQWAANEIQMLAYKMEIDQSDGTWFINSEERIEGVSGILKGVFGTVDATWYNNDTRTRHIADFKSFSDATEDYMPQLYGYGALYAQAQMLCRDETVVLHVLHGMARKVETVVTDAGTCIDKTESLLHSVMGDGKPSICKWCKWCSRVGSCPAACGAVDTVYETRDVFASLSLCQKLVVCDAVCAIAESLKKEARAMAEASPNKAIEMDGIRYELKPWKGRPKCEDICGLAGAVTHGFGVSKVGKDGSCDGYECKGITPEEFIALCDVPKSKVVEAVVKRNADVDGVKKGDVERFVNQWFRSAEGSPHFVRVK